MGVVEDFLERYNAKDWERLADCFSPDRFHRIGPFGDTISSSSEYLAFLQRVVPTLGPEYELKSERVIYGDRTAVAELIEHYRHDGVIRNTPEAIIFDLDEDGRIVQMHLYVQRLGEVPDAGGRAAMGQRED
jgi:hypothetical protein